MIVVLLDYFLLLLLNLYSIPVMIIFRQKGQVNSLRKQPNI